ncbi:tripartite tricarboxylate transporter substrate-binding protein, partial [Acinetobacter baumannii]
RAAADGYTLLLHHVGLATVPARYPSLKLDPRRELVPLALVSAVPMMVVVPAGSSIAGIDSLASRSRAGQLNWGTAGPGSASSL